MLEKILKCNGRVLILRLLASLHCALPVAMICAFVLEMVRRQGMSAWARGLLFCIPAALSYYVTDRLRAFWQFLLGTALLTWLGWLLLGHPGGAVLALLMCLVRGRARLFEEGPPVLFERPFLAVLLVFAAVFIASAILGEPLLQRLAVVSAVLYGLIYVAYFGIARLERYLFLNRDMSGLPARRIQRMAGGALLAAVLLGAALLLPAALRLSGDFRIILPERSRSSAALPDLDPAEMMPSSGAVQLEALLGGASSGGFRIPDAVTDAVIALTLGGVGILAVLAVIRLLRRFRGTFQDSRDVVQSLSAEHDVTEEARERTSRIRLLDRSPNAIIRRRYRKLVRRQGGELPWRWQTPAEIEQRAGLEEPLLHELYEKARYGPEPCGPEDVRRLKQERKT